MTQKLFGILDAIDNENSHPVKQFASGLIWSLLLGSFVASATFFVYVFN